MDNDKEVFRQQRQPITASEVEKEPSVQAPPKGKLDEIIQKQREMGVQPAGETQMGEIPEKIQQALRRHSEDQGSPQVVQTASGPQMVMTGNTQLDKLLTRLRATTHSYELITLPSLGKFYTQGEGPPDGKLNIRPMTGHEEQILANPKHSRQGRTLSLIFANCMEENYDPSNFLIVDRTYLLIYLRGISYSVNYEVNVPCAECNANFNTGIDLNSLYLNVCPEDFGPAQLQDVLPVSKFNFSYRLPTVKDEVAIMEYRERKLREFGGGNEDDIMLFRSALLTKEIEGVTRKQDLQHLINSLPINDSSYLRHVINNPPFGVETEIDIFCPSCSAEFKMELPVDVNFFFPRHNRKTIGSHG